MKHIKVDKQNLNAGRFFSIFFALCGIFLLVMGIFSLFLNVFAGIFCIGFAMFLLYYAYLWGKAVRDYKKHSLPKYVWLDINTNIYHFDRCCINAANTKKIRLNKAISGSYRLCHTCCPDPDK